MSNQTEQDIVHIAIRREVFEQLESLRKELGISNYSDMLIVMMRAYRMINEVIEWLAKETIKAIEKIAQTCQNK